MLGTARVELRNARGLFPRGPVDPGSYEVWADFGSGMIRAYEREIEVEAGRTITLRCSNLRLDCKPE